MSDTHTHHHHHNWLERIAHILHLPGYGHDHSHSLAQGAAIYDNALAIRTVAAALVVLGITTVLQIAIYVASGSVALLADTVHNLGDSLNSIPLLMAFMLARRLPTRRYTYGYGRAEDIAGILIVVSIAFSAGYILYESIGRFINPAPIDNLIWVGLAAIIGFIGNEIVAMMQIRVGRKIGSDAMVADGLHARTDGLTSLAVLIAVGGVLADVPILDPIIGIVIGLAIVGITWEATRMMWYRLMDAVDPNLVNAAESAILEHAAVKRIERLQLRWVGHRMQAEIALRIDPGMTVGEIGDLNGHVRERLEQVLPNLGEVTIQALPN